MALTQVSRGLLSTSIVDNGNATAITIDSSENVLVGTDQTPATLITTSTTSHEGVGIADGYLAIARNLTGSAGSGGVAFLNRLATDGPILDLRKDGAAVGGISVASGNNLTIDGLVASHAGLEFGTGRITPRVAGATSDGVVDLGYSTQRFQDLFLSGDIAHLDTAGNARLLYDRSSNLLGNAGTNGTFVNLLGGTTTAINSAHTFVKNQVNSTVVVENQLASGDPFGVQVRFSGQDPNNTSSFFYSAYGNPGSLTPRFIVRSNGGIANYQANDANLSDERVKRDISPLSSMWDKFKALEIVSFKYKDQTHTNDNIGVIAQQVESVAPEFVSNDGFGETPEGEEPLKTIYTADLYHAAIKALQEAMTRIETLEAKVQQLENN